MKAVDLLAIGAARVALTPLADAEAQAGRGLRTPPPRDHGGGSHGGHHGFNGTVWIVEREVPVIIEREVVREVPVVVEPPPPRPPRKPFVVGRHYASLPGGCMKLIEDGASYYYCGGGEWYRLMGSGSAVKYRAVAKP